MKSNIADSVGLKTHPVVLTWADAAPEGALRFKPGRWACVMSLLAATASKGRTCAFDRQTYGCWGGGTALGFGNCYEAFPGGVDCFCRFLADGNEGSEQGRAAAEQVARWGDEEWTDDFLKGERYLKNPDTTRRFLQVLPTREIPAQYVVSKPLDNVDPNKDEIKSVTFFVDPDQLSALVVLANYTEPDLDNVTVPWAAGCQVIGIFAYRELEREHPRALIGLTDLSARLTVRPALGKDVMSFTIPWPLFLQMEENVDGSFFSRQTWRRLRRHDS